MVKLVFLILNYKTYLDTIRIVDELLCSADRSDFRIIIVDNASPNDSYQILFDKFKNNSIVDIILSPENGGYSKGNNLGLRFAEQFKPHYVCIINNDVHFSWETIDELINIYPQLEKPAVISPIQHLPGNKVASFPSLIIPTFEYDLRMNTLFFSYPRHIYQSNTSHPNVQKVGIVPGAFLFIDFEKFKTLGYFEERLFLFCEERFLGHKVRGAGLNNYLILNLSYLHEHSKTINLEASQNFQRKLMHEGRILYTLQYRKCPRLKVLILNLAYHIHKVELTCVHYFKKMKNIIKK